MYIIFIKKLRNLFGGESSDWLCKPAAVDGVPSACMLHYNASQADSLLCRDAIGLLCH